MTLKKLQYLIGTKLLKSEIDGETLERLHRKDEKQLVRRRKV